jgi:hypothetical protein
VGSKILGARLGEGGWGAYLSGTHLGVPPWGDGVLLACSLLKAALVMFLKKKSVPETSCSLVNSSRGYVQGYVPARPCVQGYTRTAQVLRAAGPWEENL